MPARVFILRSRFGRSIFELHPETLEITSALFGTRARAEIPLSTISPHYEIAAAGHLRAIGFLTILILVCILVVRLIFAQSVMPHDIAMYPAAIALALAWAATRLIPRSEFFIFCDHWKRPLFTILREREQAAECEEFIHALLDHLEGRGVLPENPERLAEAERPPQNLWKIALGCGALAALVPPLLQGRVQHAETVLLPAVIATCGCGVAACVYSFMRAERRRWWSLVGAALCLLPPLFY